MDWEMQASENLFGFEFSQPRQGSVSQSDCNALYAKETMIWKSFILV